MRTARIVLIGLFTSLLAFASQAAPSNKWRIEVDGSASTAGSIQLGITPEGGSTRQVDIPVAKGLHENRVARLIRDALKTALGKGYHVEIDDGEDVLVKRRGSHPKLDIVIAGNSVQGIKVKEHTE
ncbi:MAG TPA: hypothetical protein VM687_11195 [Stenotrophomonas sp.]|nr:hypothetical protein [Stenotrophomonas sp.]